MGGVINPGGGGGGGGDVTGPASSTDNAIARFDSTTGKIIQDSAGILDDSGNLSGLNSAQADTVSVGEASATTGTLSFKQSTGAGAVNIQAPTALGSGSYSLTWPSSGGNSGQVLTSGGLGGQLSWSNSGFADFKTIGTGGDYADVQAMIDGGDSKGILVSNVTEDSSIAVPSGGFYLHLNDFTLTMGANQFTFAGDYTCMVEGWGPTSEIDYTQTASGEECFDTDVNTGSTVVLRNFTFDNNSSAGNTYLAKATSIHYFDNLYILNPNVAPVGVYVNNALSRVSNLYFTSPGTTNSYALYVANGAVTNITFDGTWSASSSVIRLVGGTTSNVITSGTLRIEIGVDAQLDNFRYTGGVPELVTISDEARVSNSTIYNLDINASDDYYFFTNCEIRGTITDNSSSTNVYFNNCEFNGAYTHDSDEYNFNGCLFRSNLTLQSSAARNSFNSCTINGTVSVNGDLNLFTGSIYKGNVTVAGDNNRFSGALNTGITATISSGAQNNKFDVTIDQSVTDSSGNATNVVEQVIY